MPTPTIPARCRHLHTDGRQCGSPALRAQPLCFQHRAAREPLPVKSLDGRTVPQLPAPDDFPAIQRGIAEVIRLLAEEEITEPRARTLLGGLALASQNLARSLRETRRQQAEAPTEPVTDLVNHPELGPLALEDSQEDREISIQQNQDLSPANEVFDEAGAAPSPAARFTPSSSLSPADDEKIGVMYRDLSESFSDQRHAFIREKTAELEAQFEGKLQTRLEAELRLQQRQAEPELHLTAA